MDAGIVPGVKPHLKVYALPGQSGATVMQGLDSLAVRCQEYKKAGCEFAKWRSPLEIDVAAGQPSDLTIEANTMRDLARYALICQAEGLVPIVEPDISLKGDHDLETATRVNVKVQAELFHQMNLHGVYMEGADPEVQHGEPGKDCKQSYTVDEIAEANLQVFRRCFPHRNGHCQLPVRRAEPGGRGGAPGRHQQTKNSQGPLEPLLLVVRRDPDAAVPAVQGQGRPAARGDGRAVHEGARRRERRRARPAPAPEGRGGPQGEGPLQVSGDDDVDGVRATRV